MKEIAILFGKSLDKDDFKTTESLIHKNCKYLIGSYALIGPKDICNSYEQNMIEGRNKMDELKWGQSKVEQINDSEFYVHFTDYLMHKNIRLTPKCKQKLTIDNSAQIIEIKHVDNDDETKKLNEFYRKVGILKE